MNDFDYYRSAYQREQVMKMDKKALLNEMEAEFIAGLVNICVEGADPSDHPDYVDCFVVSADQADGTPLTEDEIDKLNESYPQIAQEHAFESLL